MGRKKLDIGFAEIWHHGNLVGTVRDLAGRYGWNVDEARSRQDGKTGKGSVCICRGHKSYAIQYALPEHPELIRRKVLSVISNSVE